MPGATRNLQQSGSLGLISMAHPVRGLVAIREIMLITRALSKKSSHCIFVIYTVGLTRLFRFPTYFTYKKCNDNEYRVGYYVYFAKDGYAGPLSGHDHDWENVVVVWQRSPVSGYWAREMILLSGHGHWRKLKWADMITFK